MANDRNDMRRDRWRDERNEDDRGFFERAGDEIASWFGDEEAERRRREDDMMNRDRGWDGDRDFGRNRDWREDRGRYAIGGWGERPSSRDWDRNRDHDRGFRPGPRGASDRFQRSGWGSEPDFGERGEQRSRGRDYYGSSSRFGQGPDRGGYSPGYSGGDFGRRDYERSESPWARDDYRNTSSAGSMRDNDRHYGAWRQRQLNDLDRDYDLYCRERQERFESDFGAWRNERQGKRQHLRQIQNHMDVVGSDGESIGKVDKVSGDTVILTRSDSDDNRHHSFDCSLIETVEDEKVRLRVPAEEAKSRFDQGRGFFGRDDNEDVNLERSFSGTYSS